MLATERECQEEEPFCPKLLLLLAEPNTGETLPAYCEHAKECPKDTPFPPKRAQSDITKVVP